MAPKDKPQSEWSRGLPPKVAIQHPWLIRLSWEHGGCHKPDDDDALTTYGNPPPDWPIWISIPHWDVVRQAIPLILSHDPDRAHGAPYLNQEWCYRNLGRQEVRVGRVTLECVGREFGRANTHQSSTASVPTMVFGYTVQPREFVAWAKTKPWIDVPQPLLEGLGLTTVAQPIPALPTRDDRRKRQAFATCAAMRFADLKVSGQAGATALGFEDDETIAGYLAPSQRWGKLWADLEAWAEGDGNWGAVFAALRTWVRSGDD